jgi:hypothetical protein
MLELSPAARKYFDAFRSDVSTRLGALEREVTQVRKRQDDDAIDHCAVKFARNQANTAFVGVLELRKIIRDEVAKKNNMTRIIVAAIGGIAIMAVGAIEVAGTVNAAKTELRAQSIVDRRLEIFEKKQAARDEKLADMAATRAVEQRDLQIDSIRVK